MLGLYPRTFGVNSRPLITVDVCMLLIIRLLAPQRDGLLVNRGPLSITIKRILSRTRS
ncbi:hypothetical protein C1H76_5924 [Elsinoe australis]|uniref:Uncharacterized protein n=1 Tax=Elsinoe australis TaxID=40998 RepID=A0A4U7AU20_9PEZI|nr:hypothetical protein C1H76_5924 [Elsinoe australis]